MIGAEAMQLRQVHQETTDDAVERQRFFQHDDVDPHTDDRPFGQRHSIIRRNIDDAQRHWVRMYASRSTDPQSQTWPADDEIRRLVDVTRDLVHNEVGAAAASEQLPSSEEVVRDLDAQLQKLQNENETKKRKLDEARVRLQEPVNDAIEDGIQPPESGVLDKAVELLALVSPDCYEHDVENHVTQDRDVVTDILDSEDNYVMMKSRADGTVAIHFNICGFEEYKIGEPLDETFIAKLVRCLSKDDSTA